VTESAEQSPKPVRTTIAQDQHGATVIATPARRVTEDDTRRVAANLAPIARLPRPCAGLPCLRLTPVAKRLPMRLPSLPRCIMGVEG
jgi:hypothetical protein